MVQTEYSTFIHKSRYARWVPKEQRRETWEETVKRYMNFFTERHDIGPAANELEKAIRDLRIMPSMRCMMSAGPALARDNVAGFNCSYAAIDNPRVFDEIMYILLCGTGVGFSVERQYINKLPEIEEKLFQTDSVIDVADSKIGWCKSFRELISLLYAGQIPKWDISKVRPAGTVLKTFGGRASGPEPLEDLFRFTIHLFKNAAGRKLSSIECHDLLCKIAEIVVVGGVRRSALISLSNVSDDRMRCAKSGQWWLDENQRALANNSAVYTEQPDFNVFIKEWSSLYESRSGERGLFSRVASQKQAEKNGRRDASYEFGTNPCSEIILRPNQFCNLSEIVVREGDTFAELKKKVQLATILGTLQSTMTNFRYLRSIWKKNTEEEALLGVSMTGIMDHAILSDIDAAYDANEDNDFGWDPSKNMTTLADVLLALKQVAIDTNKKWATKLNVAQSTAITCVKPSGTVSQLVDSASGIHSRFAPYYIRRVRADIKDPLTQFMIEAGFPHEMDVTKPHNTVVFDFPQKAPVGGKVVADDTALTQLNIWKMYQDNWCEHKPSITVYYSDNEFLHVGAWVFDNFASVSGISFLPRTDHTYQQAPYEAITEEKYNDLLQAMPQGTDWSQLGQYENTDMTTGAQELACVAGGCEI